MTTLMPIGVFAHATRLSVRALRNYDRLGLLVPARIDPDTGYLTDDPAELPGALLAATIHEGGYEDVETAYLSLGGWIAERDRVPTGPAEELYLVAPGPSVAPEPYRTEIAWPVTA